MRKEFLESGRRTRFAPKAIAERPTLSRDTGARPRDPITTKAQAAGAHELMENEIFSGIVAALVDEATEQFNNSAEGPPGQFARDTAHARIKALDAIVTRMETMVEDAKIYEERERREAESRLDDGGPIAV